MQVTVSLTIDIAASSEINQIEEVVQEAGLRAMREATAKAVRAVEDQNKTCPLKIRTRPVRTVQARSCAAREPTGA